MTPLQLELTRLIGKKELTFWCKIYLPETKRYNRKWKEWYWYIHVMTSDKTMSACLCNWNYIPDFYYEERNTKIIGHPATLSDLHRYVNDKHLQWKQLDDVMYIIPDKGATIMIMYNSWKDLLDQDESTLEQIISLIRNYA